MAALAAFLGCLENCLPFAVSALFLAEGSHYYLKNIQLLQIGSDEESYMWALSSATSLFAVVAAVEIVKWSRINANYNITSNLN